MSYSALYLKRNQKITQILGIVALISFLVGGVVFFGQLSTKNGWQNTKGIEKVYIVNRSPHGFEVVWSTKKSTHEAQWVEVGTKKGIYPTRSISENGEGVYKASVIGLSENTRYYFRIRVGAQTYLLPSLTEETVTTPKEVKEKPISPAYGKVVLANSKPYANGLLIYEIDGYYPLAVYTKQTGEWLIPLTGLISKNSNKISSISDSAPVLIRLFSYPEGTVRTTVSQTRPLKQAILAGSTVRLAQTIKGKNESVLGTTSNNSSIQINNVSQIIYPKENAIIPGNSPLIKGVAPQGKDVLVLIQGAAKQYSYRTKADEKGSWLIQAPIALDPGRYTILVTIQNGYGATTIVKRTFSIIKSGEQVLGEATGSPTLIPTSPLVPTYANPTATIAPIVTPTSNLYPTAIIPTQFVPTATPPITGGGMSTYLFGALFFIVVGAGLVLAF